MFISVLELFKVGIGPSSSHTMGPMLAAGLFVEKIQCWLRSKDFSSDVPQPIRVRCTLKGSLSYTGKGHATDSAIILGLNGYSAARLVAEKLTQSVAGFVATLSEKKSISLTHNLNVVFSSEQDIVFDKSEPLPQHPNGMIFELVDVRGKVHLSETYFSIGGGFLATLDDIDQLVAPLKMDVSASCTYPFHSAKSMLKMASESQLSIAQMKLKNELDFQSEKFLRDGINTIWEAMQTCIDNGLKTEGELPGGLKIKRRAKAVLEQLTSRENNVSVNDWLCAYAMAVNEENAAGNLVVTAPTNGAAGVIPAVLYYFVQHEHGTYEQAQDFLLTASAIGGLIKHRSSISGAEVGCQGEVGPASAMAAAGLCQVRGGTPSQVENAAEIALEHHLGMTCDPVKGLVQVPCIERNAFGAIKAYAAASLAMLGTGQHFMPLDSCIAAMKQTGQEMSVKYKETSLGGLAVSITEC